MTAMVEQARADHKTFIKEMLDEYLKELSEITREEESEYPYFNNYWIEKDRYPFLISMDNQSVGFAFVRFHQTWEIAEFYIKPGNRRNGIGRQAALSVLKKFKGKWSMSYAVKNRVAGKFWHSVVAEMNDDMLIE